MLYSSFSHTGFLPQLMTNDLEDAGSFNAELKATISELCVGEWRELSIGKDPSFAQKTEPSYLPASAYHPELHLWFPAIAPSPC